MDTRSGSSVSGVTRPRSDEWQRLGAGMALLAIESVSEGRGRVVQAEWNEPSIQREFMNAAALKPVYVRIPSIHHGMYADGEEPPLMLWEGNIAARKTFLLLQMVQ